MPGCTNCPSQATVRYARTSEPLCRECFFSSFETEVYNTLKSTKIIRPDIRFAVGASGGKDSTALIHVLQSINDRYGLKLDLVLVSIDEGIRGYRDDSLDAVQRNHDEYGWPLTILSFDDLFGWTMDRIDTELCGRAGHCTFCGVFRRQALDRGAELVKANYLATGHCADDVAETVLMNVIRGDIVHLERCAAVISATSDALVPRVKPFLYTHERDIVMYCHLKRLDYVSTECIYAPKSFRGQAREFLKKLTRVLPGGILNIIHFGQAHACIDNNVGLRQCKKCGLPCTSELCRACVLLEGLCEGTARVAMRLEAGRWMRRNNDEKYDAGERTGFTRGVPDKVLKAREEREKIRGMNGIGESVEEALRQKRAMHKEIVDIEESFTSLFM